MKYIVAGIVGIITVSIRLVILGWTLMLSFSIANDNGLPMVPAVGFHGSFTIGSCLALVYLALTGSLLGVSVLDED